MEAAFCKTCNQNKPIDLFPKGGTFLYKCKSCIAERHRTKVACEICEKLVSYGNMHKHMFKHMFKHSDSPRSSRVVCNCGTVIMEYGRYLHNKTSKHLREIAVPY